MKSFFPILKNRFTIINKLILIVVIWCISFNLNGQIQDNSIRTDRKVRYTQLGKGFAYPPGEAGLRCYWWWLNSMATKESITRDMEEMKAKGYGGASIVDAGSSNYQVAAKTQAGPVFMSPEWMELYKHAVKEAERVGIELSVNVQSGWNLCSPSITPEFSMKKIVWSEVNVTGGKQINIELPKLENILLAKEIMVQAIPVSDTANFRDGKLDWNAPEGNWTIVRYGYTCTGARTSTNCDGWSGLSVDHLSPQAFEVFSNTVILPLIKAAQSVGNSVKFLQTDSWEMGLVNWTDNFPKEFKKFRGYDISPFMPVLAGRIVGSREESDRFLHDFRQTIGDCVADYHYKLFYNVAHQYGMGIHPESGGPHSAPVDALKVMAISDFPQGEFWAVANTHRITDDERLSDKQSACVAHTNGKRFVAAESPTSIGPQWKQSKDFISYLDRSCYMLQQGLYVADVLYYYGDDVPNFVFLKEDLPELNFGYDWDKCSKDVILNRLSFENGKIILPDGMSYRVLMLAPEKSIDLNLLKRIEFLVNAGMTVVVPRPEKPTGLSGFPESDNELNAIADRLWDKIDGHQISENTVGKGRVIRGQNINSVLASMNVMPDFAITSNQDKTGLDYIHRATEKDDIYFVANRFSRKGINDFEFRYLTTPSYRYEQVTCHCRVTGKVPQIWNPKTGEMSKVLTCREEKGQTLVPIQLEPDGSVFVIFKKAAYGCHIVRIEKDNKALFPENQFETKDFQIVNTGISNGGNTISFFEQGTYTFSWSDGKKETIHANVPFKKELSGKWEVHFDPKWGGPDHFVIDELSSWIRSEVPGIKYYSGTANYTKSFDLSKEEMKNNEVILDLGNVQEMASIKINGKQSQVIWSAPFRLNLTGLVREGSNKLEVEIVNLWPNRLIGDAGLPFEQRLTKTNINKFNVQDREKYLRESGLLGPVSLIFPFLSKASTG